MVRVASQMIAAAALAQIQRVAGAASTLRGVPDLAELEAVDGGVFVGRQDLAAYGNPGDVDCVLSAWEPKGECDAKTLTQVFERHIVTEPENNGLACEALEKTMPCKPVHCQMGPWKEWSACDDNGFKTRKRDMLIAPKYGGRSCPYDEDKVKCRKQDCRVCEWSAWKCDDKSGKKTRTRHVTRPKELDGAECPPLEEEEDCDKVDCKYVPDKYEEWSKCDPITFIRTQRNEVIQEALYGGKECPVKEEKCPPVNCKYFEKATNNDQFGECVADDETEKVWHRHKIYEVEQEALYGGEDCDPELGDITELCEPVDCDYKTAEDSEGVYDQCKEDEEDGKWYKTKKLDVKTDSLYGGEKCYTNGKGYNKQECKPVDCDYKTAADSEGDYGQCEEDPESGVWYKTKTLEVKTHPLYGGEKCYENGKGYDKLKCDPIKCEYDTVDNSREPTDKCVDNGSGTWYKTITRKIKTHAMYGGDECDPKDLYYEELCPKVDCKYHTLENSKKPTDKCEDDGNGKWYKTIKLDVITEAEYGGEPCHENGKGFDKEFCEPVNCELGPFGAWTDCDGKGKKEQWRDLLSPALYGGTCESQVGEDTCTPQECIVAGDDEDDDWGDCQDDGFKYKTLRIKQHPRFGAADCPDEETRTRKKPCKAIDCVAGDWSAWGQCNNEGKRTRTREKLVDKKFGGKDCPDLEEVESCDLVPCVLDDWSPWTSCDENMKRSRTRHVLVETNHGTCEPETQTETCMKVDCKVGDWEKWGECKQDGYYGPMKQSRTRPILIHPKNGGADCPALSQTQFCDSNDCHVGDWEPWGRCNDGWKKRTRKCHQKKRGGQECDPELSGNEEKAPCAEDCVVTEWSDPSPCNAEGKSVSERKVVIPASGGGQECPTDLKKEELCPAVNCVLNGWSQWSDCDSETHTRTRHREVLLEPKHGGTSCPDAESPARKRTEQCVKVDCVVSDWSGWSKCDAELKQTRTKATLVEPLNGGAACPLDEPRSEARECRKVNCRMSEWSDWSECVDGKKTRTRSVVEDAANGGDECPSERTQEHKCKANVVAPPPPDFASVA